MASGCNQLGIVALLRGDNALALSSSSRGGLVALVWQKMIVLQRGGLLQPRVAGGDSGRVFAYISMCKFVRVGFCIGGSDAICVFGGGACHGQWRLLIVVRNTRNRGACVAIEKAAAHLD